MHIMINSTLQTLLSSVLFFFCITTVSAQDKVLSNSCASLSSSCEGIIKWENGKTYEGTIQNNLPEGKGKMTWSDGSRYYGDFKAGKRSGYGAYAFSNGIKYEGDWKNDEIADKGTMTYSNGDEYYGEFENGKRSGMGTFITASGEIYNGQWSNGVENGFGTYTYTDGSYFRGTMLNGSREGSGEIIWPEGDTLKGNWQGGLLNGLATLTFSNEDVLETKWRAGRLAVKAIYKTATGEVVEGSLNNLRVNLSQKVSNVSVIENNFSKSFMGFALELKSNQSLELSKEFMLAALDLSKPGDTKRDLIAQEINLLDGAMKERGLAKMSEKNPD
jgi:hypothetical protein